jgi:hypothetical protein
MGMRRVADRALLRMTWIRGPWWDSFWLLSGLPIGVVLILSPPAVGLLIFTAAALLETGHALSPIILAWSHRGLRRVAIDRWRESLFAPLLVFTGAFLVPPHIVFGIYFAWNIYHFGMQNFGVLSLYKRNRVRGQDDRVRDGLLCLGLTAIGMGALPLLAPDRWVFLLFTGVFSFSHWLTDIGLSSRVARYPWFFIVAVLVMGSVGFVWMIPRTDHMAIRLIPTVITARWGLGFVHFLYSRWVWRLSDARVLEAIGPDLFLGGQVRVSSH